MKPTFKNEPRAGGLAGIGNLPGAEIKVKGKQVGSILGANHAVANFRHRIQIAVKDDDERIGWRWIMPRVTFGSRDQAKDWLRENFADIVAGYDLHTFDD
ncbi:hypothetical protein [Yoonia sp.]|uniref:hypothetical protein n=1 Tax=Yoonia sp. TaxID=2212373 RepID=UPI002E08208F|nr:hypothetical protein [Yoonia sp.]